MKKKNHDRKKKQILINENLAKMSEFQEKTRTNKTNFCKISKQKPNHIKAMEGLGKNSFSKMKKKLYFYKIIILILSSTN